MTKELSRLAIFVAILTASASVAVIQGRFQHWAYCQDQRDHRRTFCPIHEPFHILPLWCREHRRFECQ